MKFLCECGHVITDQTDYLPYKATFYKDQDSDKFFAYSKDIESFLEAIISGNRQKWIKTHFPNIPEDFFEKDAVVISEIILCSLFDGNVMYQCENCGRVFIYASSANKYASFMPEDEYGKGIFNSKYLSPVVGRGRRQ